MIARPKVEVLPPSTAEIELSDILEPDFVVDHVRHVYWTGECELALANICQALTDAVREVTTREEEKFREAARVWFEDNSMWPLSFEWCCTMVRLDASAIRAELRKGMRFRRIRTKMGSSEWSSALETRE